MDIHVHIHQDPKVESKLDMILCKLEILMSKADELKAELVEANNITNELAADVADLVSRIGTGMTDAEADAVKAELVALKDRLAGVAAVHTPVQ